MFSDLYNIEYLVAENCPEFRSKRPLGLHALGSISESCLSCNNYEKGNCSKNLFENIASNISVN